MKKQTLKILNLYYSLRWVKRGKLDMNSERCAGTCDPDKQVISIELGASPERTAEVLIHEVMHALWAAFDIGDEADEETAIKRIAAGLADVARENPVFVDILLKK